MASHGNNTARDTYESKVPSFYYRPTFSDCHLLREQWIRAKYERREFTHPEKQEPYSAGYREGFLWKRGRDNGQFLSRKFVLTEREGALKYFNRNDCLPPRATGGGVWPETETRKPSPERMLNSPKDTQRSWRSLPTDLRPDPASQAKEPKAIMKIEHLNATFQPAKIGHPHGLQVTYLKDNSTRNIFVYHEDGKEMVDWFNALRAARFHYLQVAFPGASDADLVPKLSRNYLKEGYMEKTGPKHTEGFRKRWFTMDDRRLMYFKDPLVRKGRGPRSAGVPAGRCISWCGCNGRGGWIPGPEGLTQLWAKLGLDSKRPESKQQPLPAHLATSLRSASPCPQDAFARGEVFIGSRECGYAVLDGLPPSTQGHHWPHGITIVTPERRFLLACETESEQRAWAAAFRKVVDRPMLPQEYAGKGQVGGPGLHPPPLLWR
ncbi:hypothetical protein MC885_015034 [Smutsia gigantea]|nr:hypothetical protein MC885_015034 [Smutsia gigantea]